MNKKTFTSILLALIAAQTAWAWDGSGTAGSPYQIKSTADLNQLATDVNSGTTYDGSYFVQTADIDMQGVSCTPIGKDADHRFGGHYDGGGYKISNFTFSTDGEYAGLFGYIMGGTYHGSETNTSIAEVHGVVLVNSTVTVTATSSSQYAGAVVGLASDCARLYDNTVIGGTVTYTGGSNYNTNNSYAGGLIGCYSTSNLAKFSGNKVSGTTVSGGGICGGLVGSCSSYSNCLSGNFADANVSSVEYDNYTDIHTYGYRQGALAGHCNITSGGVSSVNYYHSRNGLTAYGNKAEHHAISPEPDNAWVSPLYTVSAPDGLSVSGTPTVTLNGTDYYAAGATVTLTTDGDHIISGTPTVSGSGATLGTVATNKQSVTVTIGSQDVTISATLLTIAGSCGTNATWRMSDEDGDGTYETLTISGSGKMTDYSSSGNIAPWRTDFAASITTVNIADGITTIGHWAFRGLTAITAVTIPATVAIIGSNAFYDCSSLARVDYNFAGNVVDYLRISKNAFYGCHADLVIVVPTPALAVQHKANSALANDYKDKLRANLGGYAFRIDGTTASDAAYQIADAVDLRRLATAVNALTATSELTFRQTADINLGGTDFPMIGNDSFSAFRGTYDGQGFAISGLSVSTDRLSVGLFGRIDGATLRGIILVQPSVTTSNTGYLACCIGSIVGYPFNSTIENCHALQPIVSATGSGSGAKYIGAIAGEAITGNSLTNCCYYGGNAAQANGYGYATLTCVGPARKVTLGSGIASVSPVLTGGDGSNGFRYDGTDYYREGVTLTLTSDVGTTAGYNVTYSANSTAIDGETYTVSSSDVTLTAAAPMSDGQTHSVSYIDADGNQQTASAIALDGSETSLGSYGQEKWYFIGTSFSHTGKIDCQGNVHIILCDGKTMNVNGGSSEALWCSPGNLYFYGQSGQTGTLNTTGRIIAKGTAADIGTITINGGIINATGDYGIDGYNLVAINGGIVTATGNDGDGIWSDGTITLGWRTSTDRITASSYNGSISVKSGQALVDGDGNILSGTLATSDVNGKTLRPVLLIADAADNTAAIGNYDGKEFAVVQLSGRTLYKDGKWNTLYLPFDVVISGSALDGAVARELTAASTTGTTLNLTFGDPVSTLKAGTPYIIKWEKAECYVDDDAHNIVSPTFSGVTVDKTNRDAVFTGVSFKGTYAYTAFDAENKGILLMGGGNTLYYPLSGATIGAQRAYFELSDEADAKIREFVVDFGEDGETTGIFTTNGTKPDGAWYDLGGRQLDKQPSVKGVYIHGGKKVVVK